MGKVDGKSSEQNPLTPSGKRSTMNGPRGQQRSFPSGLEKDQARRLQMPKPPRVRKKVVRKHQLRKNMMKRRRRKKRKRRKKNKLDHLQLPISFNMLFFACLTGRGTTRFQLNIP